MQKFICPWCGKPTKKESYQDDDEDSDTYVATDYGGSIEFYCGLVGKYVCESDSGHVFFPAADDDEEDDNDEDDNDNDEDDDDE